MSGAACRQRCRELIDAMRHDGAGRRGVTRRSVEWAAMPSAYRMGLILMSGIDGDIGQLARRSWEELPQSEQAALGVTMRGMWAALDQSRALMVPA